MSDQENTEWTVMIEAILDTGYWILDEIQIQLFIYCE